MQDLTALWYIFIGLKLNMLKLRLFYINMEDYLVNVIRGLFQVFCLFYKYKS